MSFPSYSSFRASSVEWLDQIPCHWRDVRLRDVVSWNDEALDDNTSQDLEIEYIEISDVSLELGIEASNQMAFGSAPSRARRIVRAGDVLVSTVRTYLRAIAVVRADQPNLIASTGFAVLRAQYISHRYLGFALQSEALIGQVIAQSVGVSYPAISAIDLVRIKIAVPNSEVEQELIADFLDRETAKIDGLIAAQRRLMELLKEKRQAVISHAVTKGLDPTAPMKPSGVEWLGDVPIHWEIVRLSHACSFIPGKAHEPFFDAEGQYKCVTARFVSTQGAAFKRCTENLSPTLSHDILMVMSDLPNGRALARAFYVEEGGLYAVNQRVCIIRSKKEAARYTFYQLDRNPQLLKFNDGANQTHLSNAAFNQLALALPPLAEQRAIAKYIDRETAEIDRLCKEAPLVIELLQERRAALISAAVTGKIDVQGLRTAETIATEAA